MGYPTDEQFEAARREPPPPGTIMSDQDRIKDKVITCPGCGKKAPNLKSEDCMGNVRGQQYWLDGKCPDCKAKYFQPVRAPRSMLTTKLEDEILKRLKLGCFNVKHLTFAENKLTAEIELLPDPTGSMDISGNLTIEGGFALKRGRDAEGGDGDVILCLPEEA